MIIMILWQSSPDRHAVPEIRRIFSGISHKLQRDGYSCCSGLHDYGMGWIAAWYLIIFKHFNNCACSLGYESQEKKFQGCNAEGW